MTRTITCCVLLLAVTDICRGESFDLTSSVTGPYDIRELEIDLGQKFSQIDGAQIHFQGEYTPGVILSEGWIPPRTFPADSFYFLLRLDDPGTTWIDKSVHAKVKMEPQSGHVSFDLPLYDSNPPSIFPGGNAPANFDFLLDGEFGMSVTGVLFTIPEDRLIEQPVFRCTLFSLDIDGVAIPEPSVVVLTVMGGVWIFIRSRASRHLGGKHSSN
jgi:hypothetical protein